MSTKASSGVVPEVGQVRVPLGLDLEPLLSERTDGGVGHDAGDRCAVPALHLKGHIVFHWAAPWLFWHRKRLGQRSGGAVRAKGKAGFRNGIQYSPVLPSRQAAATSDVACCADELNGTLATQPLEESSRTCRSAPRCDPNEPRPRCAGGRSRASPWPPSPYPPLRVGWACSPWLSGVRNRNQSRASRGRSREKE